jgi:hypothetical protein
LKKQGESSCENTVIEDTENEMSAHKEGTSFPVFFIDLSFENKYSFHKE